MLYELDMYKQTFSDSFILFDVYLTSNKECCLVYSQGEAEGVQQSEGHHILLFSLHSSLACRADSVLPSYDR